MLAKTRTASLIGLEMSSIEVEVDISMGFPTFTIVGLTDVAIQESKDRVRSAIKNSHQPFPTQRITVNLAPASMRKDGAHFDLAIAVAILAAEGVIKKIDPSCCFYGELALDGTLRPCIGILSLILSSEKNG